MTQCPHCGQKLRGEWIRCPRCRELVEAAAPAPEPIAATTASQPALGWMIAGVAAMVVVSIGAVVVSSAISGQPASPGGRLAEALRPVAYPAALPKPLDPGVLANNRGIDERRAGYAAYVAGDLDSARARFQAAVDANPNDAEARNNLAQVLVRLGQPANAVPHLDEAIRLDPEKWAYRFNRARALAEQKQFPEAIADYRAASDLFPEDYATHYNLGLVYLQAKQYADAVASLERAVELAPGEPTFLVSLGTAYVGVERPDKAKATFEKFLEVAADDDTEIPRVKALLDAFAAAQAGA